MQIEKSLLYQRILIVAFWICATFSFVAEEFLPFLMSLRLPMLLAFDVIIVMLGILTIRKKWDLVLLFSFLIISFITTYIYNGVPFLLYINGLRDYISFIFVIPIINYFFSNTERKERFVTSMDRQLYIFLMIQVFCVMWQFLKYGAGDHGGGSLGNWNSGIITTLIYLISFYLIQKRIDTTRFIQSLWENRIYILLLLPTFFNETKIGFIFLVFYFLLLLPLDRKLFIRILFIIPTIALLLWGGMTVYVSSTNGSASDVFSIEYYMNEYLFNSDSPEYAKWLIDADNGDTEDIPRFTKLLLLNEVNSEQPGHFFTGFGVGTFKGGSTLSNTDFYKEYEWLLIGSIPYLFNLIVQLGLLGIIWFLFFFTLKLGFPRFGKTRNFNLQLLLILTVILILFYNDSMKVPFVGFIFMYLLERSWVDRDDGSEIISEE